MATPSARISSIAERIMYDATPLPRYSGATTTATMPLIGTLRPPNHCPIRNMPMPAYFRTAHPTAIGNVMLTGVNVPVRIGTATVMPGDLVFGDVEGVYFIPPALLEPVLDNADVIHVHDEWTRLKFDEGKYKSRDIYGSPTDPALKAEYEVYLKKRLAEIAAAKELSPIRPVPM